MAKNVRFEQGVQFAVPVPAGTLSGDPVVYGDLPGVALTDRQADGTATVKFDGVFLLPVKGTTAGGGNGAIAEGAIIYYDAAATPKLGGNSTATKRFGYVVTPGGVASGVTNTSTRVKVGY
jgi:predicted RecA/RadA family phage recombinase